MANTKIPEDMKRGLQYSFNREGMYIQLPSTCFAGFQPTTDLRQDENSQFLGIAEFVRQEKVDIENIHLKIRFNSRIIIKITCATSIHQQIQEETYSSGRTHSDFRHFETQMT